MTLTRPEPFQRAAAKADPDDRWHEESLSNTAETPAVVQRVLAAMTDRGYPERDCFAVRLGVEEALVNAVRHGNRRDPAKQVRVRYRITDEWVLAEVEDQGEGFDPAAVPDPRDPARRECPGGRGLFLMRHYLTGVRFLGRGNRVALSKRRSG
jgi:serine/threonine-protein kinase RsbW